MSSKGITFTICKKQIFGANLSIGFDFERFGVFVLDESETEGSGKNHHGSNPVVQCEGVLE